MQSLLLVGLGGALGGIARYLCQKWTMHYFPSAFPVGTFVVNITGCFFIGLFFAWYGKGIIQSENTRLFLMTGLCGGFTTFSAFTLESIGLLRENKAGLFFLYVVLSVILGLGATLLGMRMRA